MALVIEKVISIFVIVLIGYIACRLGWLPQTASKYISKLLMNIAMPCLIVASMVQQSLTRDVGINLVITSVLCLILFTVGSFVGLLIAKVMKIPLRDRGIYGFCLGYSNNGFLGFPVAQAIFGVEGLLFMILSNLMMNIHNFSFGIMILTHGDRAKAPLKEKLKRFFNIPVVASIIGLIFLIIDLDLPEAPMSILTMLGNMTVPLSMIFLGIQLAQSSFKDVAGVKINHVISLFRLVIFPVVAFLICSLIGFDPMVTITVTLTAGLPIAVVVSILSEEYGRNTKLASECVFLSTLFSLISLPIMLWLLTMTL